MRTVPAPYNMKKSAVLGAIGILPELKVVRTGSPAIHPVSAADPMPAVRIPHKRIIKEEPRYSFRTSVSGVFNTQ